jgi:hypothetical protein
MFFPTSSSDLAEKIAASTVTDRRLEVWRRLILFYLTALTTLLLMWVFRGPELNLEDYPRRAGFVLVVYIFTTVFLLFVSPFFFRRLAVLAWLTAIFAAIWRAMPRF